MRRITMVAAAIFAAFVLVSCNETKQDTTPEGPELQTIDEELYFYKMNYPYTEAQLDSFVTASLDTTTPALCSGMVSADGNLQGRNLDWCYDQAIHVLISNYGSEAKYKNMGMVTGIGDYEKTKSVVSRLMVLNDGINECGLVMQCNVVPGHDIKNPAYLTPCGEGPDCLSASLVVRFVLDNCATVDEALELMNSYKIVTDKKFADLKYDIHWLISDATGACGVIEMADGKLIFTEGEHIMTNFYITQLPDSSYVASVTDRSLTNGTTYRLTETGAGFERQEILSRCNPTTVDEMKAAMKLVWYSNTYDKARYEKYKDDPDYLTAPSEELYFRSECAGLAVETVEYNLNTYEKGNREALPDDWYTSYTVVYDRPNFTMHVCPSESDKYFEFTLEK